MTNTPMQHRNISGAAIAVTLGGFVLLYSSIKNATISTVLHSFLAGSPVTANPPDGSGGVVNPRVSGGAPVAQFSGGGGGGSAYTVIVPFLLARFPKAGAAGILGNMKVESGFSPTAYNAGEGAIGFCQWEGGRRTGLQQYAANRGTTETDPMAQLGWMMRELSTGYVAVYAQMQTAPTPGLAAAIWDAQYERSSGAARAQRVANAQAIYGSL